MKLAAVCVRQFSLALIVLISVASTEAFVDEPACLYLVRHSLHRVGREKSGRYQGVSSLASQGHNLGPPSLVAVHVHAVEM